MSAKPQIVNTRNRMLSQNIYMTLDTKKTDRNNNILIAGGSGCGKSFKFAKPTDVWFLHYYRSKRRTLP